MRVEVTAHVPQSTFVQQKQSFAFLSDEHHNVTMYENTTVNKYVHVCQCMVCLSVLYLYLENEHILLILCIYRDVDEQIIVPLLGNMVMIFTADVNLKWTNMFMYLWLFEEISQKCLFQCVCSCVYVIDYVKFLQCFDSNISFPSAQIWRNTC